jgi:hypothetical protein
VGAAMLGGFQKSYSSDRKTLLIDSKAEGVEMLSRSTWYPS